MIERTGDVFTTKHKAIGHGVNVDGVMGAGIAVQFKRLFPEMYRQYRALCAAGHLHPGQVFPYATPNLLILNIASQDRPGPNASLEWLEDGLTAAMSYVKSVGLDTIALPRIGCGIGGLYWHDVCALILDLELQMEIETEIWTL